MNFAIYAEAMVQEQDPRDQVSPALLQTLLGCLAELDRIGAHVAAAHLDAAILALPGVESPFNFSSETD